jgi:hypothetical protein
VADNLRQIFQRPLLASLELGALLSPAQVRTFLGVSRKVMVQVCSRSSRSARRQRGAAVAHRRPRDGRWRLAVRERKGHDYAGQIIERGERTWLVRIFNGRDPRTGKRVSMKDTPFTGRRKAPRGTLMRRHEIGISGCMPGRKIRLLTHCRMACCWTTK